MVDAGRKRESAQILTRQVGIGRQACKLVVRRRGIQLRLRRDRAPCIDRSHGHGPRRETRDGGAGADPYVPLNRTGAGIGYGRASQYREAFRRTQETRLGTRLRLEADEYGKKEDNAATGRHHYSRRTRTQPYVRHGHEVLSFQYGLRALYVAIVASASELTQSRLNSLAAFPCRDKLMPRRAY